MQSADIYLEMFCLEQGTCGRIPRDTLIEAVVAFTDEVARTVERDARNGMTASRQEVRRRCDINVQYNLLRVDVVTRARLIRSNRTYSKRNQLHLCAGSRADGRCE